jgi:hypothetical protein
MAAMTNRTTLALMAPTVAALALALPACGGGGATAAESAKEKMQEFALKQAECMRRHGVDVPDPKPNRGLVISSEMGNPEQVDRAMRACEKEVGKPPAPPQMSAEDQREFRDRALKHARCMREHGIDFPDPTFGPNGTVKVEIGPGAAPGDPAVKAAEKACLKLLGRGGTIGMGPPQ